MVYGKATVSMVSFDDSLCIRTVCLYRYGQFVAIGTDSLSLKVRTVSRFRYGQIVILGTKFVALGTDSL